ncbi:MAG TPA: sensor histidine kinase, partial [Actinomycetota bacterium]|nr:sensor histidine kinase [Actinomycetota bacterium]
VELWVADDGEGVDISLVPSLFEPFTRGATSAGGDGTGLGLAIVRRLAEAMGGNVSYEPADPQGARFTVSLPRP